MDAKEYIEELKPYIDEFDKLELPKFNIDFLKLYFSPLAAYLCRSTVDWESIKEDVISEFGETLSYYKKNGKQDSATTRELVASMIDSFEITESNASESNKNVVNALVDYCINEIEHGKTQIALSIYSYAFVVINGVIKNLSPAPYTDAPALVPQYLGMPAGKPDPIETLAGRVIPLEWQAAIRYNGSHFYYMKETEGKGMLIGEMYQHKDRTFSLRIVEKDEWEELNKLFVRLTFDRLKAQAKKTEE